MREFLLIGLGGVLGANVRYLVSTWAAERLGTSFPYGTLIANVAGSLLMGVFLSLLAARFADDPSARLVAAAGFLGAETTFSTFAYETISLIRFNDYAGAVRNVLSTMVLGLMGAVGGIAITVAAAGMAGW